MLKRLLLVLTLCAAGISGAYADKYWDQRVSLFDELHINNNDIVFLGNSITDGGNFEELFGREDVKNRGIRSDVIPGVMKRLNQVTKGHPKKIFLLIGINDVSHGLSVKQLTERYEKLVKEIQKHSPHTKLYLQSVMPINNSFKCYKNLKNKETTVEHFNIEIKRIADEHGATYIDLWPVLADTEGKLKKKYTNDGLHLTGDGYRAWTDHLRPYLDED